MATANRTRQMFVGGAGVDSTADERLPVVNPATREVIAEIPRGSEEDVDRADKAAQQAFDDVWFDTTPGQRQGMMLKLADAIDEHAEEIGPIESENVGQPPASVMRY